MNGRGSNRRNTVGNNFNSSDGPRNIDTRERLTKLPAFGSQSKLNIASNMSKSNNAKVTSIKNIPSLNELGSNNSSINIAPLDLNSSNKLLSQSSQFKKPKMKGYMFLRKKNTKEDMNSSPNETLNKKNTNTPLPLNEDNADNQITTENNKLIEKIMKDRKRQYSLNVEMNSAFKSKIKLLGKKPHRKVIKKVCRLKPNKKLSTDTGNRNQSMNASPKSTSIRVAHIKRSSKNIAQIPISENAQDIETEQSKNKEEVGLLKHQVSSSKTVSMLHKPINTHEPQVSSSKLKTPLSLLKVESNTSAQKSLFSEPRSGSPQLTTEQIIAKSMAELEGINEEPGTINSN